MVLAVASVAASAVVVVTLSSAGMAATANSAAGAAIAARPSCTATVTKRYPVDGSSVGVRVKTAPSARIAVAAHYEYTTRKKAGRANLNGRRTFWYHVDSATPGFRIKVDVTVSRDGRKASCSTWFTPRAVAPQPSAPAPSCTATASVYDAEYDWNNVYVNSNQPYTDATASADGYSWSYETNSSGYAEIYLNGPPPGAEITVTVGGATCYTSD
jgi:hypothetical protein